MTPEELLREIFLAQAMRCPGNDETCPCQDGDLCHYGGPDAWPLPETTKET